MRTKPPPWEERFEEETWPMKGWMDDPRKDGPKKGPKKGLKEGSKKGPRKNRHPQRKL